MIAEDSQPITRSWDISVISLSHLNNHLILTLNVCHILLNHCQPLPWRQTATLSLVNAHRLAGSRPTTNQRTGPGPRDTNRPIRGQYLYHVQWTNQLTQLDTVIVGCVALCLSPKQEHKQGFQILVSSNMVHRNVHLRTTDLPFTGHCLQGFPSV